MVRTFCHICGRITADLYEGKCQRCFIKETPFLRLPNLSVRLCKGCLRYLKKGRWNRAAGTFEDVLKKTCRYAVEESLRIEMDNPKVDIQVGEPVKTANKVYRVNCNVRASGKVSGMTCEDEVETGVTVTLELCNDCSRRAGGYYEAILQLRGRADVDELVSTLSREQTAFVTSVKKLKEGIDLYFASTQVARKSAKMIVEKYGGSLKESAHLQGVNKSGKSVYRVAISVRLPGFKKNDVVAFKGSVYQVLGFGGGRVSLFDLESRKKHFLSFKSLEIAAKLEGRVIEAVVLEVIPDRIQVMETEYYKTLEFHLHVPLKVKDEISIFKNGGVFLLKTGAEYQ
ncbi:MAG: NMD3-related protein [Candidatus Hydrothermarchaeaceae archaeon]